VSTCEWCDSRWLTAAFDELNCLQKLDLIVPIVILEQVCSFKYYVQFTVWKLLTKVQIHIRDDMVPYKIVCLFDVSWVTLSCHAQSVASSLDRLVWRCFDPMPLWWNKLILISDRICDQICSEFCRLVILTDIGGTGPKHLSFALSDVKCRLVLFCRLILWVSTCPCFVPFSIVCDK
jgi:hypothetical protein